MTQLSGTVVWTLLIVGSAAVVFLILPPLVWALASVKERLRAAVGIDQRITAPIFTQDPQRPFRRKRLRP